MIKDQLKIIQNIVIIILSLHIQKTYGQTNPVCKGRRYICSQVINIDSTLCAQVIDDKNKQIELWNCPFGYSCNFKNIIKDRYAYCEKDPDASKILPGESCSADLDCYSKKCTDGLCVGGLVNTVCKTHQDCDVSFYCAFTSTTQSSSTFTDTATTPASTTGTCKAQVTFGKACDTDYDCQNNCVCSLGVCTYYYSLDIGISANNKKACASGYISKNKCASGLSSKDSNRPKPCSSNKDCVLVNSNGDEVGQSECQCGYNPGSFSYCSLSEGDEEYQSILTAFLFVLNTNFHCHTSLRYGPCKYIYDDEYKDYNRALNLFNMAPQVTYNDYCIQRSFNWQYWQWLHGSYLNTFLYTFLFVYIFLW